MTGYDGNANLWILQKMSYYGVVACRLNLAIILLNFYFELFELLLADSKFSFLHSGVTNDFLHFLKKTFLFKPNFIKKKEVLQNATWKLPSTLNHFFGYKSENFPSSHNLRWPIKTDWKKLLKTVTAIIRFHRWFLIENERSSCKIAEEVLCHKFSLLWIFNRLAAFGRLIDFHSRRCKWATAENVSNRLSAAIFNMLRRLAFN